MLYFLFGMRCDVKEIVGIAPNLKIKAPRSIDPSLPDIACLVILFGSQGRVAKILNQKSQFAIKELLNL